MKQDGIAWLAAISPNPTQLEVCGVSSSKKTSYVVGVTGQFMHPCQVNYEVLATQILFHH